MKKKTGVPKYEANGWHADMVVIYEEKKKKTQEGRLLCNCVQSKVHRSVFFS